MKKWRDIMSDERDSQAMRYFIVHIFKSLDEIYFIRKLMNSFSQ